MTKRILVTGMGMISPIGNNVPSSWNALLARKCGINKIKTIASSNENQQPTCFPYADVKLSNEELKTMWKLDKPQEPRFIAFALHSAAEAMKDAQLLNNPSVSFENVACIIGCGMGSITSELSSFINNQQQFNHNKLSPFFIPRILPNLAAGHVSIKYGLQGPILCPSTACASGAHAISEGARLIQSGEVDIALCGGTESVLDDISFLGFNRMKALKVLKNTKELLPEESSRPFDEKRQGFVMGEGCGLVVLESEEHFNNRNNKTNNLLPYAILAGFGMSGDAYHIVSPSVTGKGAEVAMNRAILSAKKKQSLKNKNEIQYVNAHATSTPLGDLAEATAIANVFKDSDIKPFVSSQKSSLGHLLGAAGAVEAIFTILALKHQMLPDNLNLENPSEDISKLINLKKTPLINNKIDFALTNSFGFGGTNVSLLFQKV